ncbi:MAG: hypothetical protein NT124_01195 [Candidatus Dependentiae bacterium]|nr:hypothetical protein [Candidatus Dependentiae bacterium]
MKNIKYVCVLVVASITFMAVNAGHEARFYPIDRLVGTYIEKVGEPDLKLNADLYGALLKELNSLEDFKDFKQALIAQNAAGSDAAMVLFKKIRQELKDCFFILKVDRKQKDSEFGSSVGKEVSWGLSALLAVCGYRYFNKAVTDTMVSLVGGSAVGRIVPIHQPDLVALLEGYKAYGNICFAAGAVSALVALFYGVDTFDKHRQYENLTEQAGHIIKIKDFWDTLPLAEDMQIKESW